MLDIKKIRAHSDKVKEMLVSRCLNNEVEKIDKLLELDLKRRDLISESDDLKSKRNKASDEIAKIKKQGCDLSVKIQELKKISIKISELDNEVKQIEKEEKDILLYLPNLLNESVPIGTTSKSNVIVKESMTDKKTFEFTSKDHLELGKAHDLFDFNRSSKISGSGFPFYKGAGAALERALINFMLDFHCQQNGYTEVLPPFLVNEASLFGTGQFPKFRNQVYSINNYNLFVVPTSEVPITNFHSNEILDYDLFPIKYVGHSACFRSEAGSYGKDVKGLLRLHQFNKVELVIFCLPEQSYELLEQMTCHAEAILEALKLPYRRLLLCSGDTGAGAAKCYDIEVWSEVEQKFLEVSSCSNCEDFQSRRLSIRFKRDKESKLEFIHTLNGSGLATPRLMAALLEHYQLPNGNIALPEVLQPYLGKKIIQ